MLLGAEEGLFSYRLKEANAKPVRIQGLTHVHQMSMLPLLNCLIVLAGTLALLKHSVEFPEFVIIIVILIFSKNCGWSFNCLEHFRLSQFTVAVNVYKVRIIAYFNL